jgi:hypothetical protein
MREPPKVEFEVLFSEPRIARNKTVRGLLTALILETERTLELLIPHIKSSPT